MKIAYNPLSSLALTAAPAGNDITFDLPGINIYVRGVRFKGTDTTYNVFKKHTSSGSGGYNGLVPVPSHTTTSVRYLREDGTWQVPIPQVISSTYTQLSNEDFNSLREEGRWYFIPGSSTTTNGPTGVNNGAELYIGRNASGYRYLKVITAPGIVWFRYWTSTSWSSWVRWYTDANTDKSVLLAASTTANFRPLIIGYTNSSNPAALTSTVTNQVYTANALYALPSTGTLFARIFNGDLRGNADTSTSLGNTNVGNAALPVYFASGKPIACTASSLFSGLTNDASQISITIAGQNRKLTVNYASNAGTLGGLAETSFFRTRGSQTIASSIPTTTELSSNNNLSGNWNVTFPGASGHLVQFNTGTGSTRYMQFYSYYSGSLYWRNSTDSTLNTKSWKTIVDSANYTGIVLKIGTATKGSATLPIYLNAGTPTACSTTLGVSITGNAATATKLLTARTIWGQSFNGTANVNGALSGATTGSFSSTLSANRIVVTSTSNEKHLEFSRSDYNYIASKGHIGFITGGTGTSSANQQVWIHSNGNTKIGAGSSSAPAYKLDVYGTLRATGAVTFNSSLRVTGNVTAPTFIGALSGNASSASKLTTTTAGSATRPVYFANGIPVAGTYTFGNASGNIPISNGTLNTNLNADKLDGYHVSSLESYKLTVIDASGLNNNTWYPVTMVIGNSQQTRIRIEGTTSANATWNSRSDKNMALILDYTVNGSHWGWTHVVRTIHAYQEGAGTSSCLRGLGQLTNSSTEYVYVRGGAKYNFYVSRFITPALRTSTYTTSSQSVAPATSAPAAISRNVAYISDTVAAANKVTNSISFAAGSFGTKSYNGSAAVTVNVPTHTSHLTNNSGFITSSASISGNATTATKLQTARTIWGQSFNGTGNVSGALTGATTGNFSGTLKLTKNTASGTAYHSLAMEVFSTGGHPVGIGFHRSGYTQTILSHESSGLVVRTGTISTGALAPITASTFVGALSGNATTATKLQTARTINGTSFNGTANITTAYWGATRTITLSGAVTGSASVNGSLNITITTTYQTGSIDGRYVGGKKKAGHGSSGTAYTADTYSSNFVNKAFVAYAERGSWDYANNGYITTDTGVNIPLAGTAIFQWGASDTNKTLLFITPYNSSGVSNPAANDMLFYTSNGSGYTSAWTRVLTHRNYTAYTVTKTGGGASGTWGISITGTAAAARKIYKIDSTSRTWSTANSIVGNGLVGYVDTSTSGRWDSYGSIFQFSNLDNPTPGTSNHWLTQIWSGTSNKLGVRWRINTGGWSAMLTILTNTNYVSYADTRYVTALGTNGNYLTWTKNGSVNNITVPYSTRSGYLYPISSSPDNSRGTGYGARVFYSWNIGLANNATTGYSNGITIGSNPGDTAYGFLIVLNMWDDRTYTRRYNHGWQSWKTLAWTTDVKDPANYYWANIKVSASSSTSTSPTFSTAYTSNWFRSTGSTGWYSQTYGGGWYMSDSTWIRTYGSKSVYQATGLIRTDGYLVTNGGLTAGATSPNNGTYKLHVTGASWSSGLIRAGGGFYHNSVNSNSYVLLAGGSYKGLGDFAKGNAGASNRGVYVAGGTVTAMTYYLNTTVNSGTSGNLAYYSGATTLTSYTNTVGSVHSPVYMNAGVPTICSYYSFLGAPLLPVVLVSGFFYRSTTTSGTWLYTGYKHSLIGSPTFYINGGVMRLTFSNSKECSFISAAAQGRLNFSGANTYSLEAYDGSNGNLGGRSTGSYWFNSVVTNSGNTSYLYVRAYRLANSDKDAWYTGNACWGLDKKAIHSVSFTIFGFIYP